MQVEIYPVDSPGAGRLSLMPRPRGGEWLADEVASLAGLGVSTVISLLTRQEQIELDLTREAAFCQAAGIEFVEFGISDRECPPFTPASFEFIEGLAERFKQGGYLAVHCRIGIGRSALVGAAVLVRAAGLTAEQAFEKLEAARGRTLPDTLEQREWVEQFEQYHKRKGAGQR